MLQSSESKAIKHRRLPFTRVPQLSRLPAVYPLSPPEGALVLYEMLLQTVNKKHSLLKTVFTFLGSLCFLFLVYSPSS